MNSIEEIIGDEKYLYHVTNGSNLDKIYNEGLIPMPKEIKDGKQKQNIICLTIKSLLYQIDDNERNTVLKIDVKGLKSENFDFDFSHTAIKVDCKKPKAAEMKQILFQEGTIAYLCKINPKYIDVDGFLTYENRERRKPKRSNLLPDSY